MSFPRKALQAFTLSDGTYIPAGTFVSASFGAHFDEEYYENPDTFDGFRFVASAADAGVNNVMSTTSARYLPFGHGRHACVCFLEHDPSTLFSHVYVVLQPARLLVSFALKALMAHIILNYDIKMGADGKRKPDFWFSYHCTPASGARYAQHHLYAWGISC